MLLLHLLKLMLLVALACHLGADVGVGALQQQLQTIALHDELRFRQLPLGRCRLQARLRDPFGGARGRIGGGDATPHTVRRSDKLWPDILRVEAMRLHAGTGSPSGHANRRDLCAGEIVAGTARATLAVAPFGAPVPSATNTWKC